MASPTVLSVGSVTISANGGQTGDLLQQIINASQGSTVVTVASNATALPTPPAGAGPFELVIPAGYTGTLVIPSGYAYVVYSGTGTLSGGDPTTAIVGNDLSYTGSAGTVVGAGSTGVVSDNGNNAVMSFFGGTYSVTATGNNDTVKFDSGSSAQATVEGANSVIDLGSPASSSGAASAAVADAAAAVNTLDITTSVTGAGGVDTVNAVAGSNNLMFLTTAGVVNETGGSSTVITGSGGVVTLNATGGNALVFDFQGGNVINASTSTEFVGAPGAAASDYNAAAGGADTIFASTAIDYSNSLGTANSLFFLGGAGAVTVSAAAAETVFGGSGGGSYSVGATSFEFFGGGGADTVTGASGSPSILAFGAANESLTINDSTGGNSIVSFGTNDSINASGAGGGNTWQIVNQTLPAAAGGTFTGDSTLVGSSAGGDTFVVYVDASAPAAHTVVIDNWQASDAMFIANLASASQSLNATDLAAVNAFDAGGGSSLTLSDGTTIEFNGAKPTTIAHV